MQQAASVDADPLYHSRAPQRAHQASVRRLAQQLQTPDLLLNGRSQRKSDA